jgi:DNA-binding response OmpR family regulator
MEKKYSILLVEDDLPIVNVLKERLEQENFDLLVASDGEEGLKMAIEKHPDLILLDIIIPKMGGLIMLEKLRKDSWGKKVKVIVLTNLSNIESEKKAIKHKVISYITKTNCSLAALIKKIKKNLP